MENLIYLLLSFAGELKDNEKRDGKRRRRRRGEG